MTNNNVLLTLSGQLVPSKGPAGPLYVDPDTGHDANPGTAAAPFATVKKALETYFPFGDEGGWDSPREIVVGGSKLVERIHKPFHKGPAPLIIRGALTNHGTYVPDGGPSGVTGEQGSFDFPVVEDLSGEDFSELFLTSSDPDVYGVAGRTQEAGVILSNSASAIRARFKNPGVLDAFSLASPNTLEVQEAVVEWQPEPLPAGTFGPTPPLITNDGGPLLVEGFKLDGGDPGDYLYDTSLVDDRGGQAPLGGLPQTTFHMCTLTGFRRLLQNVKGAWLNSCVVNIDDSIVTTGVQWFEVTRGLVISSGGEWQINNCGEVTLEAVHVSRTAGVTNKVQVNDTTSFVLGWSDFRTEMDLILKGTAFALISNSFEQMSNSAVRLRDGSIGRASDTIGSAGNTNYGIEVGDHSKLEKIGTGNTLTGSNGDLKVGTTAHTWGGGDLVDETAVYRG